MNILFHNTHIWTNHNSNILIGRAFTASLKTLNRKNLIGQKSIKREKECSQLNIHIAPLDMNNLNLVFGNLVQDGIFCEVNN